MVHPATKDTKAKIPRQTLPLWKKILLIGSGVFVLVGVGLGFAGSRKGESGDATTQSTGSGGFLTAEGEATGATETAPGEETGVTSFSPFFVKGGLSFFVGFALGYALRTFFKISAIVIGVILLAIFGLSYAGVLDIDWTAIDTHFDQLVAKLKTEGSSFKTFITGSLPSAGIATLGLATGFKK